MQNLHTLWLHKQSDIAIPAPEVEDEDDDCQQPADIHQLNFNEKIRLFNLELSRVDMEKRQQLNASLCSNFISSVLIYYSN